jgi:hypothetical protein
MRWTIILLLFPTVLWATPVPSIEFPDGNVLNIQGIVGSGPDTAYLAIDFSNNAPSGPSFAWQYNFTENTSNPTTEYQMLAAVKAADNALTISPQLTGSSDFVANFSYGANIGSAQPNASPYSYWASWIGQHDSTDSNYSATQNVNWVYAPYGVDEQDLGYLYDSSGNLLQTGVEGLIYGWTVTTEAQDDDNDDPTPLLPEIAVPEPASLSLLILGAMGLMGRRRSSVVA